MNPYDFVPIVEGKQPKRAKPAGHDNFSGKSGLIECTITTLKPLFIPFPMDDNQRQKRRLRESAEPDREGMPRYHNKYIFNTVDGTVDGVPIIPGSSLKGVIRSVAEAVANSCVTFFEKDKNQNYRTYSSSKFVPGSGPVSVDSQFSLPNGFYPCTSIDKLCITCRLFGFQSLEGTFQGNVSISDAKARAWKDVEWITLTELSGPKPHHKAFYALSSDPLKIAGRKFYFHHGEDAPILISPQKTHRNSTVKPIQDATFDFEVTFTSLSDAEYELLLYSLFLEDGVCHKIGYGKPAGLGSVKIEPLKLTLFDIEKRYKGFTGDDKDEKSGENLKEHIREQTNIYREDKSSRNLTELRSIWQYPGIHDIKYPDFKK